MGLFGDIKKAIDSITVDPEDGVSYGTVLEQGLAGYPIRMISSYSENYTEGNQYPGSISESFSSNGWLIFYEQGNSTNEHTSIYKISFTHLKEERAGWDGSSIKAKVRWTDANTKLFFTDGPSKIVFNRVVKKGDGSNDVLETFDHIEINRNMYIGNDRAETMSVLMEMMKKIDAQGEIIAKQQQQIDALLKKI